MKLALLVCVVTTGATGCGGRARDDTTVPVSQRFTPDSTATDVLDSLRFEAQPPAPKVGFAMAATSKWGSPAALAALRGGGMPPDTTFVAANGVVYQAPAGQLPFSKVNRPLIVRLQSDELQHAQWHEAVANIGRHEATADLPMILDDAKRRWDELVARETPRLEAALVASGERTPGEAVGTEATATHDVFVPSWTAGRIVVIYARRLVRASAKLEHRAAPGCTKYIPRTNEHGFCPPQPPTVITTSREYAADLAFIVSYDATGKFVGERAFAPHALPGAGVKTVHTSR